MPALGPEGGRGRFDARTPIALFDTPHNRKITWKNLLQQASDWEGTLWGKPEWADRPSQQPATWWTRERVAPGTVYEYNDTRVNVLALAALNVWRRPLPDVLRELVMDPISASPTWRWYGYDNSWVVIDGQLDPVGERRRSLGRRHVHQRVRSGAFRAADDAQRQMGDEAADFRGVDQAVAHAERRAADVRLHELLPEYPAPRFDEPASNAERAGTVYWHLGNGTNAIICDPGARSRGGDALDRGECAGWVRMQRVLASLRDAPRAAGTR